MTDSVNFYDNWVERQFKTGINERHLAILEHLKRFIYRQESSDILEIGCGIGTLTFLLARHFPNASLTGLDISPQSINLAKQLLQKFKQINFETADFINFKTHQKFDYIIFPDVLEHIPLEQHEAIFEKCKNILKTDGKIFIHIPDPAFLHFLNQNNDENLLPVDQPLFLDTRLPVILQHFDILYLKRYAIRDLPYDYLFLVLHHKKIKYAYQSKKLTFLQKVKTRLQLIFINRSFRKGF